MASKVFCDICGRLIETNTDPSKRTYTIKHKKIDDICNSCYQEIVKFIEDLKI